MPPYYDCIMKIWRWDWILSSTVADCARLLKKSDRRKIVWVSVLQFVLSVLDLIAVGIVGVLGALAISGVESQKPGDRVSAFLRIVKLENIEFQNVIAILGCAAALLLVSRTLASVFLTRKTLFFLSYRGALLSAELVSKLLSQSLLKIQSRSSQLTLYSVTMGVETIVLRILGTITMMVSDATILFVMVLGLFIVDAKMALMVIFVFGTIGLILYKLMHKRAQKLGSTYSAMEVSGQEKIIEVLNSYRELTVGNRKNYYSRQIGKIRHGLSEISAEIAFMPNISKYVIESTVVIGALLIAGVQFMLNDATRAVGTLSIFLAAGTRIAPAALRLQQGAIQIKMGIGSAKPTLDLIKDLSGVSPIAETSDVLDQIHTGFKPSIRVESVSLTYPGNSRPSVNEVSFEIKPGTTVAFVGPSGAGKTTIIDILLGVLDPQFGTALISGLTPQDASKTWPGAIAYVPQDIAIASGTIRENVAMGYSSQVATDELVLNALEVAGLSNFVVSLKDGIDTVVGERGTKISGGQRQRLGIARAMFTKPALLVLDEATSALDGETELQVSDAIRKLRGSTTVVLIAHRLSTVRDADKVIYMADGRVIASGTFDEVRSHVPDFDRQASLMGL